MLFRSKRDNNLTLITYANEAFRSSQELCAWTGKHIAHFDHIIAYGRQDIDRDFYKAYQHILDVPRGNGLWLWKPYFIKKTLEIIHEGDILFYCDSGACFCRSIKPVLEILNRQDIWVSELPLLEKQFTQRRTIRAMGLADSKYTETRQIQASFIAFRKSDFSMGFVEEWLSYCCNENILSPVENSGEEIPEFIAHREDQSILSLLIKKYDIRCYSDPSQFQRVPERMMRDGFIADFNRYEDYKPFIVLHRTKGEICKKTIFHQWIYAILPRCISKNIRKLTTKRHNSGSDKCSKSI